MSTDRYSDGLRALHNLHVALDEIRCLPDGATGFTVTRSPLDWLVERLEGIERDAVIALRAAERVMADAGDRP